MLFWDIKHLDEHWLEAFEENIVESIVMKTTAMLVPLHSFRCDPLFVYIRRSKVGQVPLFEKFLGLRSFIALISFLARC